MGGNDRNEGREAREWQVCVGLEHCTWRELFRVTGRVKLGKIRAALYAALGMTVPWLMALLTA